MFSEPVRSPTFQELGTLASVLSPSLGRCLARTEPCDVAVDGFRGLGVFLVPALEKPPVPLPHLLQVSQHRWSLAGTLAASQSQRWGQVPTWEEVGGSLS